MFLALCLLRPFFSTKQKKHWNSSRTHKLETFNAGFGCGNFWSNFSAGEMDVHGASLLSELVAQCRWLKPWEFWMMGVKKVGSVAMETILGPDSQEI